MATVTSTPTATPVKSAASVTASAAASLLESLDAGSGVDSATLVGSLVEAQFAAKRAQLAAKTETLTSQISGVSTLKSTITDFAAALEGLVKGGTLTTQPVSSAPSVLTAAALPGATLAGMTSSIRVNQLAAAQTAVSARPFASAGATVGTGTLTLKIGTGSYDAAGTLTGVTAADANGDGAEDTIAIDITDANASLTGIAAAINAKKAGVTASVVTDADGAAYLSLKGTTGAAQAFTLSATSTTGDLSALAVGPGATGTRITQTAKNAKLTVDGVDVERGANEISDLVAGVKLSLQATSAAPVSLTTTTPTTALSNAVNDFVATYNNVLAVIKEHTDPITGELRGDSGAKTLLTGLKALTSKVLLPNAAPGTPATLAAIGVRTNRDGSLQIDDAALTAAIANAPQSVEAMFAYTTTSATGINAAMQSLKLNATSTVYGLGASATRYTAAKSDAGEAQEKIDDQAARMTTRLTQQFSSMNSRVSAYKSTQSFMQQQIDMWTKAD